MAGFDHVVRARANFEGNEKQGVRNEARSEKWEEARVVLASPNRCGVRLEYVSLSGSVCVSVSALSVCSCAYVIVSVSDRV